MTNNGQLWLFHEHCGFKSIPPPMDTLGFGKLMLSCANGDGRITPAERAWVLGFLDAFGTDPGVLETLRTYDGKEDVVAIIAASPTVKLSATSALYEAVRACSADGELHQDEIATLRRAAKAMGLESPTVVRDLIDLHQDEQHIRQKRLRHIYPDGIPFQD
ncbi:MAG: hypothetical protein U0441_34375 [Polyangiaceae bacterium]